MRHHGGRQSLSLAIMSLSIITVLIAVQPTQAKQDPAAMILFYPPVDCKTSFDPDFWAEYDSVMAEEWRVSSQTICLDKLSIIEKAELQSDLQELGLNVIVMSADDHFLDGINDQALGVAQPAWNTGSVKFNGEYTTTTLSHETLHSVLEDLGYPKACYVDKVHENQFSFSLKEMGDGEYPIVNRFDC
jgi:hypothetical protein